MKREFIPMSGLYDMNIGALRMYYAQRPTPKPENEVKNVVFRCDVVKSLEGCKEQERLHKVAFEARFAGGKRRKRADGKGGAVLRCRKRRAGGGNGVIFGWPFLYGKIKAALVFNAAFVFRNAPARKNPLRKNPKARPTFP